MTTNEKSVTKKNQGTTAIRKDREAAAIKQGSVRPLLMLVLIAVIIVVTIVMLFRQNVSSIPSLKDLTAQITNSQGGAGKGTGAEGENAALTIEPLRTIYYDSGEESEFCLYRNYLVECSKDTLSLFGKNGEEAFRKNIEFQKPMLKKAGNYLLVADVGGRTAFVIEDKNVRWEERFNNNITNISINAGGYIAVVLETVGYRSTVRVMAPIGRKLFDWVVADDYVVSTEISPSESGMVINRIKTNGISVRSVLEFLDLKSEPFAAIESAEGNIFLKTQYLEDGTLATATEDEFIFYSENREVMVQEGFDAIYAMTEFPKRKITLAAQRGGRSFLMEYQRDGKSNVIFESELPIVNMTAENGLLIVNLGSRVLVMKENGKIALDLFFSSEVLYGSISGKSEVLIVTKQSAEIYAV